MAKKTNCTKNNSNYYRVSRTIGHDTDGKPIRKDFYGSGINEATQKAELFMQNLKLGLNIKKNTTINSLFPEWLFKNKKNELKPSTFETYEGLYRNYIASDIISKRPLDEIKSINIQQYYDRLQKRNAVGSTKKVSFKRIKCVHKLLHLFFAYCEKEGYILRNPCNNVTLPKDTKNTIEILEKKTKIDFFTEEEIPTLIKAFNGSLYQSIVIFALATGMRQGEILGLQWDDLDFENRTINVIHNLSNSADFDDDRKKTYSLKIVTPKSHNSIRTIPMNDTVYNMLINANKKCNIVFPSRNNTYICNKNIMKVWKKRINASGLRYRKFHDLRHTFATIMLSKGCDLITLKELMGHSSIKITEIYLEAIPKTKTEIIKNMDFILN